MHEPSYMCTIYHIAGNLAGIKFCDFSEKCRLFKLGEF